MEKSLTTIQKVILLQEVDIFEYTTSEDLSKIAFISEEKIFPPNHTIYQEGELSDSMYMVITGQIKIHRNKQEVTNIGPQKEFGAWSLFDDEMRVVSATTTEESHLLKISKEDFLELLSENIRITQGILKKFSRRLRSLMGQIGPTDSR